MKRKIRFTAEYVEEWDDNDEFSKEYANHCFSDWEDCDYDNVGRPISRLEDCGWEITYKEVVL